MLEKLKQQMILDSLRNALPGLIAVYLFGSRASDDQTMDSDWDLAVLAEGKLDPNKLWDCASELANLLNADVDLVDLRNASTIFQHQILQGTRLWANESLAERYECYILREYLNFTESRSDLIEQIQKDGRVYG